MNTDALIVKKPYYFYEKIKDDPVKAIRARFLGIHRNLVYSYLVKTRFDEVIRKNILVYSPLEWYVKYETLDDIFSKTVLPTDVVNIIEEYV
jgi:hypothetical protein